MGVKNISTANGMNHWMYTCGRWRGKFFHHNLDGEEGGGFSEKRGNGSFHLDGGEMMLFVSLASVIRESTYVVLIIFFFALDF